MSINDVYRILAEDRRGVVLAEGGTEMLTQVLDLFVQFATIGGGALLVWGAIALGTALKDQNGPAIQSGMWQIVGGGLIIAAAQLFKAIAL